MMLESNKIIVIGCCGAGKSTFAKNLAQITGLPLYHLDNLYWRPDKTHLELREFLKMQKKIMKTDRWIMDGNYGGTIKHRIKRCELIYFFDFPADVCLEGVMKRDKKRTDIACELEPDQEFLDYINAYHDHSRPKVLKLLNKQKHKTVVTFQSHEEADKYLHDLKTNA